MQPRGEVTGLFVDSWVQCEINRNVVVLQLV